MLSSSWCWNKILKDHFITLLDFYYYKWYLKSNFQININIPRHWAIAIYSKNKNRPLGEQQLELVETHMTINAYSKIHLSAAQSKRQIEWEGNSPFFKSTMVVIISTVVSGLWYYSTSVDRCSRGHHLTFFYGNSHHPAGWGINADSDVYFISLFQLHVFIHKWEMITEWTQGPTFAFRSM